MFEDVLRTVAQTCIEWSSTRASRSDWRAFDAVVAMGGPMSANDDEASLLADRREAADRRGGAGRQALLGRLPRRPALAASLGARVYPGTVPEVGILPVRAHARRAHRPGVRGAWPHEVLTLQWHGDTFDLPHRAVRLAGSPAYPNQAFRVRRAYGVQFHLEVSAEMAREWAEVPEYVTSLERTLGSENASTFLAEIERRADEMRGSGRALFERWLDRVAA